MRLPLLWENAKKAPQDGNRVLFIRSVCPHWVTGDVIQPKFPPNKVKTAKYSLLNFFPKNLFEQFRRAANFYFLCVAIIQTVIESPVAPWTSVLPLLAVVSVTAVKQGYEDYRRHREDRMVNRAPVTVLEGGVMKTIQSHALRVGAVVRVVAGEQFPADLLLLLSSGQDGECNVNTVNLDGETNLKKFQCPAELGVTVPEEIDELFGVVTCQAPHPNLYDFKGRMECSGSSEDGCRGLSLSTGNLLLRGSRLVNTDWVYGCVVYTGPDTKLALNLRITRNKFSTVEKTMNYYLIVYFVILVLEVTVSTVLKYLVYDDWLREAWYLPSYPSALSPLGVMQDALSFLVIYNYVIPISLYVTLEMQKFLGALFFVWDEELKDGPDGEPAKCNTSDLNEELGQVQYLFTDKTGTLTENRMRLQQLSCAGNKYLVKSRSLWHAAEERHETILINSNAYPPEVKDFLSCLALCHTVQAGPRLPQTPNRDKIEEGLKFPKFRFHKTALLKRNKGAAGKEREEEVVGNGKEYDDAGGAGRNGVRTGVGVLPQVIEHIDDEDYGDFVYQANSPDEKALVEACQRLGVVFTGQSAGRLCVQVQGRQEVYELLQVLEFDSDRRRMSVCVRSQDGRLWLVCKGADSAVLPLCDPSPFSSHTTRHLHHFATAGLRTLVLARRLLSEDEYRRVLGALREAQQSVEEREVLLSSVYSRLENNLELLGATAVEDQLQDGVELTLESLKLAGIKVWVLTGDKQETAANISFSCGHFKRTMVPLELTDIESEAEAKEMLWRASQRLLHRDEDADGYTSAPRLTLDGHSATFLLLPSCRAQLAELCCRCCAVLCCRMTPKQKAEVVRLVKSLPSAPICAAIGDGANDVAMIQEAHIGIGIMGSEGRQAVRCSDFGFSRFRFLRRALLVHGRWYYVRVATLVHYSFYKNVTFILPQLFFAFNNGMSTQSIYESLFLTFYNITFTSLPIIIYGLTEQDIKEGQLLRYPHLYRTLAGNAYMSWTHFWLWAGLGLWHSAVPYYGLRLAMLSDTTTSLPGDRTHDLYVLGTAVCTICVTTVNCKLLLETRHHTAFLPASVLLTMVGYVLFCLLYTAFISDMLSNYGMYWVFYMLMSSPSVLLSVLVLVLVSLLPDICMRVWAEHAGDAAGVRKFTGQRPGWLTLVSRGWRGNRRSFAVPLQELVNT